ncbi:ABC transporter ATP-binding protein [Actinomyces sp. MRS3W]|uniref:ABC transporter ATP-binding protein n=1 Tax=Actinomyces sp. MRS3W TaxID=2800796 RepID=UPI0028FD2E66|nr:ABC transporter ATP-binding protein [Actinomyces sp. MRS3W]MDU0348876.1 ABC transporter ATP-binding protein [Actinomyces sp. MRS3W]
MSPLSRYRHYLGVLFDRGQRWRLTVAVLGNIVIALMDTASVLLIAPLVLAMSNDWDTGTAGIIADHLGITTQNELVLVLLCVVVGGFVLKDLLTIAYTWWSTTFTAAIRSEAQIEMSEYYMRLPYHLHAHLGLAVILRKTSTSVVQAYTTFAGGILSLLTQVFSVACIGTALIIATPAVSLSLVVFIGLSGWIYLRVVKPINARISVQSLVAAEQSYNTTFDAFGAIKETQLRSSYPYFLGAIATPVRHAAQLQRTSTFLGTLPKQLMEILFMVGLALSFLFASLTGNANNILPSLAVLVAGAFRLLPAISGMLGSLTSIRHGEAGTREFVADKLAARASNLLRVDDAAVAGPNLPLTRELRVEDVRFRYNPDTPEVLKGVSLTIKAGSTVAFVGSSGAGKSTLLDVVMGLQTPTSGRLLVDGTDVATRLNGWQRNIGVVPQEVFLTDRTIAENVAFDTAKEDIDEALVRDVLRQADILDFVESQPEGIWSSFGERGRRLSGGQRQRIGIARALYRRPSVLILDEATSALDNETEARIAETIAALHGRITVIIVAHRLSTVREADMIAFLTDGVVEATGTFTQLQERSDGFRRLVELASLEEHSA